MDFVEDSQPANVEGFIEFQDRLELDALLCTSYAPPNPPP